jgi:hypothetical protein
MYNYNMEIVSDNNVIKEKINSFLKIKLNINSLLYNNQTLKNNFINKINETQNRIQSLQLDREYKLYNIKNKKQNLEYLNTIDTLFAKLNLEKIKFNDYYNLSYTYNTKLEYYIKKTVKYEREMDSYLIKYEIFIKNSMKEKNMLKQKLDKENKIIQNQIQEIESKLSDIIIQQQKEIDLGNSENNKIIDENITQIKIYNRKLKISKYTKLEKENIRECIYMLEEENEFIQSQDISLKIISKFNLQSTELLIQKDILLNQIEDILDKYNLEIENLVEKEEYSCNKLNEIKLYYKKLSIKFDLVKEISIANIIPTDLETNNLLLQLNHNKENYNNELNKDKNIYVYIDKTYISKIHKLQRKLSNIKLSLYKYENQTLQDLLFQIINNNTNIQYLIKKNMLNQY